MAENGTGFCTVQLNRSKGGEAVRNISLKIRKTLYKYIAKTSFGNVLTPSYHSGSSELTQFHFR